MDNLIFREEDHTYWLGDVIIPSVTQILSAQRMKKDLSSINNAVLEASCAFGTAVHKACELDNRGDLDEETLDEALIPYIDGWRKFIDDKAVLVFDSECLVYSSLYRYAGTLDAYCIVDGDHYVVDIKTAVDDEPANALQLAGYALAYKEMFKVQKKIGRLIVRLNGSGKYKLTEHKDVADERTFLCALSCYQWRKKHGII